MLGVGVAAFPSIVPFNPHYTCQLIFVSYSWYSNYKETHGSNGEWWISNLLILDPSVKGGAHSGLTWISIFSLSWAVHNQVFVVFVSLPFTCQYILLELFPKAMHVHFSNFKSANSKNPFHLPPSVSTHCWLYGGDPFGLQYTFSKQNQDGIICICN